MQGKWVNHLGPAFPLKEENLRPPSSSEACKFCIGSNTHCMPEGTVADIYIYKPVYVGSKRPHEQNVLMGNLVSAVNLEKVATTAG